MGIFRRSTADKISDDAVTAQKLAKSLDIDAYKTLIKLAMQQEEIKKKNTLPGVISVKDLM